MKDVTLYKRIGKFVQERREEIGMSQMELAFRADFNSRCSIANLEAGRQRLPIHRLYAIAKALKVEPWDLLP